MQAAVCRQYGPPEVLQIQDVAKPAPKGNEVLIKIHATAVTSSDCFVRSAIPSASLGMQILMRLTVGISRPRRPILGMVLAGEIEAAGKAVGRFRLGDRVYAFTSLNFGCYAQYTCLRETATMASAPSNLTHEEVAAIPYGGFLALYFLRKGIIRSGQQVFIYGASGAVGTAAVQLAKYFGAEVTAACSTVNLELVRSLGADVVMDYTRDLAPTKGRLYDLVLDAVGKRKTSALKVACATALASHGQYVSVDRGMPRLLASDLTLLKEVVEAEKLRPVIDRRYSLEQIAEAHRYVELGHKKGNVVVAVAHDGA